MTDRDGTKIASTPSNSRLEFRNVSMTFPDGTEALKEVSFSVDAGEFVTVVGPSGCGKSTLLRIASNLETNTGGKCSIDRNSIGYVFQDATLMPWASVAANVRLPLDLAGVPRDQADARVAAALHRVGLSRFGSHRPRELSGGQKQRVCIARALAVQPDFLVCDEAVAALDVSVQAQIVNLLQDLQRDMGLTYLFIAHDLSVVRHISDRVAVMYLGKIVEVAEKRTIYASPQHPYTRALIAAVPAPHPSQRSRGKREHIAGDIPSALNPPSGCRFHTRCPHVMPICREAAPSLIETQPGHQVACHLMTEAKA